jgi:murein DD-endopeptidase MepM/ murein hydrolase activator NlpD
VPHAPAPEPATPEIAPAAKPDKAAKRAKPAKRRRSWTVMLVPPTGGAVRSYEIRRWQLRLAVTTAVTMLIGALVGGLVTGMSWSGDAMADLDEQLWDAQLSLTAMGDTIQTLRVAANIAANAPIAGVLTRGGSAAGPARVARASTAVALRPMPGVVLPLFGRVSSGFSLSRRHPILRIRRPHYGVDLAAPAGTHIRAPAPGRVLRVEREFGYGVVLEIDHGNGVTTRYGHLRSALVTEGQQVNAGDEIALVGSSGLATGPHLHYEVRVNGRAIDPLRYVFGPGLDPAAGAAPTTTAAAPASPGAAGATPAGAAPQAAAVTQASHGSVNP